MTAGPGRRPAVLMLTGAYFPELSGGGLQCKSIVDAAGATATFTVLTTSTDAALPAADEVDGVVVRRVYVDVGSRWSQVRATGAFVRAFVALRRRFDLVHLHGFSSKTILATVLARLLGKRIVLTLHTAEQDEPAAQRARGRFAWWAYTRADRFIAVSKRMTDALAAAGIAERRIRLVPNGVDIGRFRPAAAGERERLRARLGLPAEGSLVLFVGFFSADKGPHVLFDAWRRVSTPSSLVFVGATRSTYFEVDARIADEIRAAASRGGVAHRVAFVERTSEIELFYRAADLFVFPSRREAFGMALIEAMASGLPCIASRLPGVTDQIVRDGETAVLVPPHDVDALAAAIERLVGNRDCAARMGAAARQDAAERFAVARTAEMTLDVYRDVLGAASELPA